jgi:hypothetical protein
MCKNIIVLMACAALAAGCGAEGKNVTPDGTDMTEIVGDGLDSDIEAAPPDGECLTYEECNGVDDDCDGRVDEDFDLTSDVWNCGACGFACDTPNATPVCRGSVCQIGECEDGFYDVDGDPYNGCEYACVPDASAESEDDGTCEDGLDNDCDGRIDVEDPDCAHCVPEFCNHRDDDCDSLVDEDFDLRSDPVNCGDCGVFCPDRPNAHPVCILGECDIECDAGHSDLNGDPMDGCEEYCTPSADPTENVCNGVDDDCDGRVDEDYEPYTCGNGACEAESVCAGGEQVCIPKEPQSPLDRLCDDIDNDCDGEVDEDFEPVLCVGACAENARCDNGIEICGPRDETTDATCDGIDGDCDNETDEDYVPYLCGMGVCENLSVCTGGRESCTELPPRAPDDATCDDLDDDCDGVVDDDYVSYACGVGVCVGTSECINGLEECNTEDPVSPNDTVCNGLDDDCDGSVDEDYVVTTCGTGLCQNTSSCSGGVETPCVPGNDDSYESFGGDSCPTAVHVGVANDNPATTIDVTGTIYPYHDDDWYRVTANDDADTSADEFNFEIFWVTRPPNVYFDVFKGNCSTSSCVRIDDCANYYTDFHNPTCTDHPPCGEDPCRATSTAGFNTCDSDTSEYYIHVYSESTSVNCAEYTIRIRNNPTSPGTGCIHP